MVFKRKSYHHQKRGHIKIAVALICFGCHQRTRKVGSHVNRGDDIEGILCEKCTFKYRYRQQTKTNRK